MAGSLVAHRYRVVGPLGAGSVGDAFEVVDEALGFTVCLKLLKRGASAAPLRREFELLRGLYHPNVVELHDFGLDHLTTSLVRGSSLDRAAAGLSDDALLGALCDALRGLAYLHAAGLRHGDVKPENVLVEEGPRQTPASPRAVLIDLSCAEELGVPSCVLSGTPGYFAPELVARGRGRETIVDGRADLHAFGVMLDDLLRDRTPLAARLAPLVRRLTAPQARERPASANEVIEALGRDPQAQAPRGAHARALHGREAVLAAALAAIAATAATAAIAATERAHAPSGSARRALDLTIAGPRGSGRSRMLRELKWRLMERSLVVEGFSSRPDAVVSLLERATGLRLMGEPLAALMAAETLTEGAPTILVVDDVDLLEPEQAALWSAFLRCLPPEAPCVTLTTALRPRSTALAIETTSITLGELEEPAIEAWCDEVLGAHHQLDARLLQSAVGGLPADLELALAAAGRGATPADLAAIVARETLGGASIAPLGADRALLFAIVGLAARPLDTGTLLRAAGLRALPDDASSSGLLRATASGWTPPRPITHEALVRQLGGDVVADAHRKLAAMEIDDAARLRETEDARGTEPEAEHLARACEHLARAGDTTEALAVFRRAGASMRRAPRPWIAALETLAATNPRDAELLEELARTLLHAGEPARAQAVARQLLASDARDPDARDPNARGPNARGATTRVRLLSAECELERGQPGACLSTIADVEPAGDPALAATRAWLEARAHLRLGQNDDALRAARLGLGLAPADDDELLADLSESAGIAALYVGLFDEAHAFLERASARARHDPKKLLRAVSYQAILAFRRGDNARALEGYRRAHEIAEGAGIIDQLARTSLNLGTALHQEARYADALAQYDRGERLARALDQKDLLLAFLCNAAKVRADLFDLDAASAKASRLEAEADAAGAKFFAAAALTLHAEVAEGRGELASSWELHDRAKRALDELGAHRECLEEEYEQGRIMCARGDVAAARAHLAVLSKERDVAADLDVERDLLAAAIAASENDLARALDLAERAARASEVLGQPALLASALGAVASVAEQAGLSSQAEATRARVLGLWGAMTSGLPGALRQRFYDKPERKRIVERITRTGAPPSSPPSLSGPPSLPSAPTASPPSDPISTPATSTTTSVTRGEGAASERLATAERLLAVFRKLNSTLDTDDIVAFAVDEAIALTGAERGFLLLGSEGAFRVALARNMDKSGLDDGAAMPHISRSIADEVIRSERPIVTVDALADRRFAKNQSVHALKLCSVLAVPIRSPDGVLGALYLDNRWAHATFAEGAIDLLLAFGDQVALALRNAAQLARLRAQTAALAEAHARLGEVASGQALEIERLEEEVRRQQSSLEKRFDEAGIVGRSSSLRRVLSTLDRVIDSPLSILVGGESGTGKELIARAVHLGSRGRDKPFVAINCGALPATLLESELFGHKKGAFTGADRDRTGLVLAAAGGTLFLDELGEMPLETQVKLLRVLQEREVRAVGSERAVPVDFRLVAATNRNLEEDVARGKFREDLFYRVSVVSVTLPPLRDRQGDLPELAAFFATRAAAELGKSATRLTSRALRKLAAYDWPGNIRQLSNVITRAVVLAEGSAIDEQDIELPVAAARSVAPPGASPDAGAPKKRTYRTGPIDEERRRIEAALERVGWNVVRAADELGLPRATFYRRMRLYGLERATDRRQK